MAKPVDNSDIFSKKTQSVFSSLIRKSGAYSTLNSKRSNGQQEICDCKGRYSTLGPITKENEPEFKKYPSVSGSDDTYNSNAVELGNLILLLILQIKQCEQDNQNGKKYKINFQPKQSSEENSLNSIDRISIGRGDGVLTIFQPIQQDLQAVPANPSIENLIEFFLKNKHDEKMMTSLPHLNNLRILLPFSDKRKIGIIEFRLLKINENEIEIDKKILIHRSEQSQSKCINKIRKMADKYTYQYVPSKILSSDGWQDGLLLNAFYFIKELICEITDAKINTKQRNSERIKSKKTLFYEINNMHRELGISFDSVKLTELMGPAAKKISWADPKSKKASQSKELISENRKKIISLLEDFRSNLKSEIQEINTHKEGSLFDRISCRLCKKTNSNSMLPPQIITEFLSQYSSEAALSSEDIDKLFKSIKKAIIKQKNQSMATYNEYHKKYEQIKTENMWSKAPNEYNPNLLFKEISPETNENKKSASASPSLRPNNK